ncbi:MULTISPECIES: anti-sigma factor [unclassified Mesorhizobium]|uniref:anti-sigma factor family protein n=1 Tax=unclassified Mesorhizobium TaxID=325217 RepID=UPI000BB09DB6|nr:MULTISPECIES: anti-sigma factor [unclassified Mesorhizobium]TGT60019.1 anti-sigma factor [Mesorhizobium sp. M00.F.Ca.ET.170.01.1.1]AZO08180.1 anti-sigma factor [Mesorhizobium sp. M3A.F.Ca.ET.080.04.2.1]PBB85752.1 Fis family transcriptional regulator [Mesorhizobium sp. WSM3876]RWB70936.1 MAG: anti-sigma factor [Mesorhizobium sp.]RWB89171.1 MAG: anti-sigma factor [Mesorhizobium sp.]
MTAIVDPVTDADLDAYIDDQLDVARRIEVEAFLSARPEAAARVMSDLRTRDELRVALAGPAGVARPATADAARRLERGLARRRVFAVLQRAAAAAVLVAAGWLASGMFGPMAVTKVVASTQPPAYVADAVRAHRTTLVRETMPSQPEAPGYNADEIRAATAIVMPSLPADWRIRDVQVYPSQFGPSVEMAIETNDLGLVSLFAIRPGTFDVVKPTVVPSGDISSAYFQIGEVAYAVVGRSDAGNLDRAAERLARTLY